MTPKFSLQNVLDVRHSRVEALEIEFGRLLSVQTQAENRLAALQNLQTALLVKFEQILQGEIDLFSIDHLRMDVLDVDHLVEDAAKELVCAKQRVEDKRRELINARQGEEVLGILKKKLIDTYNQEQAQIEARLQDDIYIARAFREQVQGA